MPFLARSLLLLGGLFLSHACYSAHEHTHLLSHAGNAAASSSSSSSSSSNSGGSITGSGGTSNMLTAPVATLAISSLPADVTAEVLLALVLLTFGIVLSAEPLRPIRWDEWAASVEHGEHGPKSRYLRKEAATVPARGGADTTTTAAGDSSSSPAENITIAELGQRLYGGPTVEGYSYLDNGRRMGFLDVRARRKEFAEWVRNGGQSGDKVS